MTIPSPVNRHTGSSRKLAFPEPPMDEAGQSGPQVPWCRRCGTDEYLIWENYVPPRLLPTGALQPANISYTCSSCEQFSGHEVPASWVPPDWFWYE